MYGVFLGLTDAVAAAVTPGRDDGCGLLTMQTQGVAYQHVHTPIPKVKCLSALGLPVLLPQLGRQS